MKNPEETVPCALRRIMARLALSDVGGTAVPEGIVPWNQTGISESPFVLVYQKVGFACDTLCRKARDVSYTGSSRVANKQ